MPRHAGQQPAGRGQSTDLGRVPALLVCVCTSASASAARVWRSGSACSSGRAFSGCGVLHCCWQPVRASLPHQGCSSAQAVPSRHVLQPLSILLIFKSRMHKAHIHTPTQLHKHFPMQGLQLHSHLGVQGLAGLQGQQVRKKRRTTARGAACLHKE